MLSTASPINCQGSPVQAASGSIVNLLLQLRGSPSMFSARKKISKEKGAEPDTFEESVAQVCVSQAAARASTCTIQQSGRGIIKAPASGICAPLAAAGLKPSLLQALFDLEATNQELKSDLRDLYITGAKEVDVNASRKAIIIHVSSASCLKRSDSALHLISSSVVTPIGQTPPPL